MVIGSTRNTKFTSDMRQLRSQDVCLNIYVVRWTIATTIAELQLLWPPYMFIFSQFTLIVYKHITLMHWSSNHHSLLPAGETTIRNHYVWHFRINISELWNEWVQVYLHIFISKTSSISPRNKIRIPVFFLTSSLALLLYLYFNLFAPPPQYPAIVLKTLC